MGNIFNKIYEENLWQSSESKSGSGSEMKNTEVIRKELPLLLKNREIKSMLDIPCGDYNWMKTVNLGTTEYYGADVVDSLIENNKRLYPGVSFQVLNIIHSELPKVDLLFVRDCLGHLSNANVLLALENMKKSGSKYLLATSFITDRGGNPDIKDGGWKCINLTLPPFSLKPILVINENCQEGYPHYNDKSMMLFEL